MKVREYEREVLTLLCANKIPKSVLHAAINKPARIECRFTGVGYYLDITHRELPEDRIVCNEPHVKGLYRDHEVGFIAFIEKGELTLECFSYDDFSVLPEIRNGTVQISTI